MGVMRMDKIGMFFGTDSGTTRLMAKKMAKRLGDLASKPLNVNRISVDDMLRYDALILGTPSYGAGEVPGVATGVAAGSWAEFLPQLQGRDLSGKTVALYGLGNQEKYADRFAGALFSLYDCFRSGGATVIGAWPTDGYQFEDSRAVVDGRFVGLVLDQNFQAMLSEDRIDAWLNDVKPALLAQLDSTLATA